MSIDWSKCEHRVTDPFAAEIPPALLNSADIARYIRAGCLIEVANFSSDRLKPASYELQFHGKLHMWENVEGKGLEPRCIPIKEHCAVKLPKNSISYLWTEEKLYLPEYIAARFNLHIRHVHKGILLGTGPLIDPGFSGSLLIPLHNLTDRDYEICGGEGIIWVEFTKVSPNPFWTASKEELERPRDLKGFPTDKHLTHPNCYFKKAEVIGGVESAFKGALQRAESSAAEAKSEARKFRRQGWYSLAVGVAAIAVAIWGVWWTSVDAVSDAADRVQDARNRLLESDMGSQLSELRKRIDTLEQQTRNLSQSSLPAADQNESVEGAEQED